MTTATAQRKYKATFILDTRDYKDSLESLLEKITKTIETLGGSVTKTENLGQKEFVRVTDRKFPSGIYVAYYLEGAPDLHKAINERFRLDKTINRILIESDN